MKAKPITICNAGLRLLTNRAPRLLFNKIRPSIYSAPNLIEARITKKCNLKCQQCPVWYLTDKEDLPTESWKNIILGIKNYIGPFFIRFYGGEPFCRCDFLEILGFCSKNDICSLITTNGTFIVDSVASELIKNNMALVNISIDGMKPLTHDRLRGVEGTYKKAMGAIEKLRGRIPVEINTTIMSDNLDEVLDLSEFAYKNKIMISFQGLVNWLKCAEPPLESLFPSDVNRTDYIIDELIRRKNYNKFIVNSRQQLLHLKLYYRHSPKLRRRCCGAIDNNRLIIKGNGDVHICAMFNKPVGNIIHDDLCNILRSEMIAVRLEEMKKCDTLGCMVMRGYSPENWWDRLAKIKRCFFNDK